MSKIDFTTELSTGADYESVAAKYRPIIQKIGAGELNREKNRILPFAEITLLKNSGFTALRVPKKYGGDGVSIDQLFQLLIELAKADSNITQALRGHFAFVEDRLIAHRDSSQEKWFKRFVNGEIAGNAWTEIGPVKVGESTTYVSQKNGEWLVSGKKFYTTGTIFADWIDLTAIDTVTGANLNVIVNRHQAEVEVLDDWNGFGQRTSGSGTAILTKAHIEPDNIINATNRFKYQTGFYQTVLNSILTGISLAAVDTFGKEVIQRKRIFSHGNGNQVRHDPQILQVIGKASSQAYAAKAITITASKSLQTAYQAHFNSDEQLEIAANNQAELEVAKAQVTVIKLSLDLTSELFNALSASAAINDKALDRFWRNARTISSHNPVIYKEKAIANWELNHHPLPFIWHVGEGKINENNENNENKAKIYSVN